VPTLDYTSQSQGDVMRSHDGIDQFSAPPDTEAVLSNLRVEMSLATFPNKPA
jgi:hypothetical protein